MTEERADKRENGKEAVRKISWGWQEGTEDRRREKQGSGNLTLE